MFFITTVTIDKNWKEEPEIRNRERNPGLKFNTIEEAKALCNQLGVENYEIVDADERSFSDKVVFKSSRIVEVETREQNQKEEFQKSQEEKVKKINELPTTFDFKTYNIDGKQVKIFFQRDVAVYHPRYSHKIECYLKTHLDIEGTDNDKNIYLSDYLTRGGKFLKQKFSGHLIGMILGYGLVVDALNKVALIVDDLKEMKKKYDEINAKLH